MRAWSETGAGWSLGSVALALLVVSCGGSPEAVNPTALIAPPPRASASAAPIATDASTIGVSVVAAPPSLSVDGALGEWGSLVDPKAKPQPASHIALAVEPNRVVLAAELRGAARDGAWLAVRFPFHGIAPLMQPGEGGGLVPLDCEHADDAAKEACRAQVQAHDDIEARMTARATRVWRLDAKGITERGADGSSTAFAPGNGVAPSVRVAASGDTLVFEAILPVTALPDVTGIVADTVSVAAKPSSSAPDFADGDFVDHPFDAPVAFEPDAELRNGIFTVIGDQTLLRYAPGGPSITLVGHPSDYVQVDFDRVFEREQTLRTPGAKLGDVEVVKVGDFLGVAVLRKGHVLDLRELPDPVVLVRDGEIHAFALEGAGSVAGVVSPAYRGFAVGPDGTTREDLIEVPDSLLNHFASIETLHDPDYATFGFVGLDAPAPGQPAKWETHVTFRWDAKKRVYTPTIGPQKPIPKTPKKAVAKSGRTKTK